MFYKSVVASVLLFAASCWSSRLKAEDINRLDKLGREAVMGRRIRSILENSSHPQCHPQYNTPNRLRSTFCDTLLRPKCTTEHHRRPFFPASIGLYNASL